jgi:hypothetical protein
LTPGPAACQYDVAFDEHDLARLRMLSLGAAECDELFIATGEAQFDIAAQDVDGVTAGRNEMPQ